MQFYECFEQFKNKYGWNYFRIHSLLFFFGNAFLLGLKSQICINGVSMGLLFENLHCTELGAKETTKSTHFFVIAFNRIYTSDNIPIGPDVCFLEVRDTHAVKRPTSILKCVYDW